MSIKTLAGKASAKIGRQVLAAQQHSPTLLVAAGVAGFGATVFLACRATLKLNDVLAEGEEDLKGVDALKENEVRKKTFSVQLQTAIKVAKLYAPAVIVGGASLAALTGSHIILKRRNAGLVAAYATLDKMYKDYRGRVVQDQGVEKDREYLFGTIEKEIVEEGPNGPEITHVKGYDVAAIKANAHSVYHRVFDYDNPNWSEVPQENQFLVQSAQNHLNDKLRVDGYVFLNDAYDLLGFEKTAAGQMVGWVRSPKLDENGVPQGDGYIDFGIWSDGALAGKQKILNGHKEAIVLDFNVDGNVLDLLKKV